MPLCYQVWLKCSQTGALAHLLARMVWVPLCYQVWLKCSQTVALAHLLARMVWVAGATKSSAINSGLPSVCMALTATALVTPPNPVLAVGWKCIRAVPLIAILLEQRVPPSFLGILLHRDVMASWLPCFSAMKALRTAASSCANSHPCGPTEPALAALPVANC